MSGGNSVQPSDHLVTTGTLLASTFLGVCLLRAPHPSVSSMQQPALGRQSTLSATTKPTRKNRLLAGRNGITRNPRPSVRILENERYVNGYLQLSQENVLLNVKIIINLFFSCHPLRKGIGSSKTLSSAERVQLGNIKRCKNLTEALSINHKDKTYKSHDS